MSKSIHALSALCALTTVAVAGARAQAAGTYTLGGEIVSIYNLAGFIEVRNGAGSTVSVVVQPGGPDANELTVATGPLAGEETLRVIYPSNQIVYRDRNFRGSSEIRVDEDGTFFDNRGRRRGERVQIRSRGRGLEAHADMTIDVPNGQRINVYLGLGEVTVTNVNGDLKVDVASAPVGASGTSGRLLIDTGSGAVDVRDAEGDVTIDTGSGSVEVTNIRGQRLSIDTGSGSVSGDNITVQDLNVDTGSGRITLRSVSTKDVLLDTGSGSISLDLMTDVDNLAIDTGSGGVTINYPEALGAELDLQTSSGGIEFDAPITVRRFDRESLTGSIGDGRGRIHVDTGSGSIRFRRR